MPWGKTARLTAALAGLAAGFVLPTTASAQMGASYKLVAFTGQTAPGGSTYASFLVPRIAQNGAVGFAGSLFSEAEGVFAGQPGALQRVAVTNADAPGTGGLVFSSFSSVTVNSDGTPAFLAEAFGEVGVPGLWAGNSSLGLLANTDLGGLSNAFVQEIAAPSFMAGNRIAAKASLLFLSESVGSAVAIGAPGNMQAVLVEGDSAPGFSNGETISSLYENDPTNDRVDQNDSGLIAFKANVQPSATPSPFEVIYAGRTTNLKPLAVQKNAAPDIANAVYNGFQADPSLSSDGKIAIVAELAQSDSKGAVVPSRAIFAGSPGALHPIVRDGDSIPGKAGATFKNLAHACVNETGDVVFKADILYPNLATRPSIWVRRIDGDPVLIAASGVTFDTPAGAQVATNVDFAGAGAFNDLHEAVFTADFASGSGVYIADTRPLIPWLRLSSPRKRRDFVTTDNFVVLKGTAQDETGIAKVEYSVTRIVRKRKHGMKRRIVRMTTPVKLAKGDRVWSFRVPLSMGRNLVTITATDKLGNVSEPLQVVMLRYTCKGDK
jgi:hypothetical protein